MHGLLYLCSDTTELLLRHILRQAGLATPSPSPPSLSHCRNTINIWFYIFTTPAFSSQPLHRRALELQTSKQTQTQHIGKVSINLCYRAPFWAKLCAIPHSTPPPPPSHFHHVQKNYLCVLFDPCKIFCSSSTPHTPTSTGACVVFMQRARARTHAHAHPHPRTHARTHARTHTHSHKRTHTQTHTHIRARIQIQTRARALISCP